MDINQFSDQITEWLQQHLTPDKIEVFKQGLGTYFGFDTFHKNMEFYAVYIGHGKLTARFMNYFIAMPMPEVFNDTVGKSLEQVLRSLGT